MNITERQVFEEYAKTMRWDITIGEGGKYADQKTEDIFRGWKARADMANMMEKVRATNHWKMLTDHFNNLGLKL